MSVEFSIKITCFVINDVAAGDFSLSRYQILSLSQTIEHRVIKTRKIELFYQKKLCI